MGFAFEMEPILGQRKWIPFQRKTMVGHFTPKWIPFQRKTMVGQKENHPPQRRMIFLSHGSWDLSSKAGTTYSHTGRAPLNFFNILNSRYIYLRFYKISSRKIIFALHKKIIFTPSTSNLSSVPVFASLKKIIFTSSTSNSGSVPAGSTMGG